MSVKRSEKQLSSKGSFCPFLKINCSDVSKKVSKALELPKVSKKIKFEGGWDKLESKSGFQRQSITKYLRLTLVFM